METEQDLIQKSLEAGAHKAFVIDVEKIPFDENLRTYCEANTCGSYGKNYACPPAVGDVDEVISEAKEYTKALVFQTIADLEDSFDFEGMQAAEKEHSKVGERIKEHIDGRYDGYLHPMAGGCSVCEECAKILEKPCRYPDRAISSLEAYCINVVTLADRCGMNYIHGQNTVTYFGAFLFNP
jgi:predicted metal-binding protein